MPREIQHKQLAAGKWKKLSFFEQMANIGSEVTRAINWRSKSRKDYANLAFERALELIDLTIADPKNIKRLKEIVRVREILADTFLDNIYNSSDQSWNNYFFAFNYAAKLSLAE